MMNEEYIMELQRRIALYDDEPAYRELFFTWYDKLVKFSAGYTQQREPAEEIVSDVFIKLWQKRSTLNTITNLPVYLYISAKNASLNYITKQKRKETLSLDAINIELPTSAPNPEQLMITAEMVRRINEAINALPPRCKMVFKLVKEDGLPYKDVSAILNISIKTIDNQLAVALKKISQSINLQLRPKMEF